MATSNKDAMNVELTPIQTNPVLEDGATYPTQTRYNHRTMPSDWMLVSMPKYVDNMRELYNELYVHYVDESERIRNVNVRKSFRVATVTDMNGRAGLLDKERDHTNGLWLVTFDGHTLAYYPYDSTIHTYALRESKSNHDRARLVKIGQILNKWYDTAIRTTDWTVTLQDVYKVWTDYQHKGWTVTRFTEQCKSKVLQEARARKSRLNEPSNAPRMSDKALEIAWMYLDSMDA